MKNLLCLTVFYFVILNISCCQQLHSHSNRNNEKNSTISDSIELVLKSIDFKSYEGKSIEYLINNTPLKNYEYSRLITENGCILCLNLRYAEGLYVGIEPKTNDYIPKCPYKTTMDIEKNDAELFKKEIFLKATVVNYNN